MDLKFDPESLMKIATRLLGFADLVNMSYFFRRAGIELWVIDNKKSWSQRADARRIILRYQAPARSVACPGRGVEPSLATTAHAGINTLCLPG